MSVEHTLHQAEELTDEYILFLYSQATEVYQKEMHGEGCGCRTCKVNATANLDWVTGMVNGGYSNDPGTDIMPYNFFEDEV